MIFYLLMKWSGYEASKEADWALISANNWIYIIKTGSLDNTTEAKAQQNPPAINMERT